MDIYENVLIEMLDEDEKVLSTLRILLIDLQAREIVTIDTNDKKALPLYQKLESIQSAFDEKSARISNSDPFAYLFRAEEAISIKHREYRDRAWAGIAKIVQQGAKVFDSNQRSEFINKAVAESGRSNVTIYKDLRRYWQGGQKPNALLPHFDNSGGRGKERTSNKKLGRPSERSKLGQIDGINVTNEIKNIIIRYAKLFYEKEGKTLKDAYQGMLEAAFSKLEINNEGIKIPILFSEEHRPTYMQFCYWYKKDRDLKKTLIKREGQKKVNLRFREVLGDSTQMAYFPGSLWQIDSTMADIYLVSSLDRSRIIGRPVLYMVVDVFSRMIVGFNVSLEGPSWLGAALALENATRDKVQFCTDFNLEIALDQWPCQHLCRNLLTDRGSEYLSKHASQLTKSLGIELTHTPAYRPDWKAVVERLFRLINDEVITWEPGAVVKDRESGDPDYRLDALYTLDEFRQILIRLILHYNNFHWLTEYPVTKAMIEDKVDLYPIELWNWGISNYGRPRKESADIIKLNLLPSGEASITRRGINFNGLRYTSNSESVKKWFIEAGINGRSKINVAYDPRRMETIYLRLDDEKRLEPCYLLPFSMEFRQSNLEEVQDYLAFSKATQIKRRPSQQQAKAALNAYIKDIKDNARVLQKDSKADKSKNQRLKGIRDNRRAERQMERDSHSWDLSDKETSSVKDKPRELKKVATDIDDYEYIAVPQETEMLDELLDEIWNGDNKKN